MFPIVDTALKALLALVLGGAIRVGFWIYQVMTNHLPHIQQAAEQARDAAHELSTTIPAAIEKQTTAIVNELKEQRQDIRTLTAKL